MAFADQSILNFTDELASKAPVPGGGGAAALVGAVGTALASMVGILTSGKKKYAAVEEDIQAILQKAEEIRAELLRLMDADAAAFAPLAAAYAVPKEDPTREDVMQEALEKAAELPLEIMRTICHAIDLHKELLRKGSRLALSDVGVGAACCEAALMSAGLNVFINTKSMTDRGYAEALNLQADAMLQLYCGAAENVCEQVFRQLRENN